VQQAFRHPPPPGDPPWDYFLTIYGGPDDASAFLGTPACGGRVVDGEWWYATGAHSFGCDAKLELRAGDRCAVVEVVDNGPAEWVEESAADACGGLGYIIDTSPLAAEHLFGLGSAGWSDCLGISVRQVDPATPTGPQGCGDPSEPEFPDPDVLRARVPLLSIQTRVVEIPGQEADLCRIQGSASIFDIWMEQETTVEVEVKNHGILAGEAVQVGVSTDDRYFELSRWTLLSDASGEFLPGEVEDQPLAPHRDDGGSFFLPLADLTPGETKRAALRLKALGDRRGEAGFPEIRAWVANVEEYYQKASFDSAFTNVGRHQTYNGGDLRDSCPIHYLSYEICDEVDNDCDGAVDNDCAADPLAAGGAGGGEVEIGGSCGLASTAAATPGPPATLVLIGLLTAAGLRRRRRG
jgi:MYXO-CTERM domain-containing protein